MLIRILEHTFPPIEILVQSASLNDMHCLLKPRMMNCLSYSPWTASGHWEQEIPYPEPSSRKKKHLDFIYRDFRARPSNVYPKSCTAHWLNNINFMAAREETAKICKLEIICGVATTHMITGGCHQSKSVDYIGCRSFLSIRAAIKRRYGFVCVGRVCNLCICLPVVNGRIWMWTNRTAVGVGRAFSEVCSI